MYGAIYFDDSFEKLWPMKYGCFISSVFLFPGCFVKLQKTWVETYQLSYSVYLDDKRKKKMIENWGKTNFSEHTFYNPSKLVDTFW